MPKLTIEGHGEHEVEEGRRLVNAVEECGVEIGHRCGGLARCTTCRVEFENGEPPRMTRAEQEKLAEAGLAGKVRLACQCRVEGDMALKVLMTAADQGWSDTGPQPSEEIEPEPQWIEIPAG